MEVTSFPRARCANGVIRGKNAPVRNAAPSDGVELATSFWDTRRKIGKNTTNW
jgi:hypothetical protein